MSFNFAEADRRAPAGAIYVSALRGLLLLALAAPLAVAGGGGPDTVRVSVFGLFRPVELSVQALPGAVLRVTAGESETAVEGSTRLLLRLTGGVVEASAGRRRVTAPAVRVFAQPRPEFVLSVPGRLTRRFHGTLEVTASADALAAIVAMSLETAVASALAAELPASFPAEALKAQAVATRSYYRAQRRGRHAGFDFCDTTHCQHLRAPPAAEHPATRAARVTRGLVVAYRGQALAALFSASCGGRTRTLADIGLSGGNYPYYAVECAFCREAAPAWRTPLDPASAALLDEKRSERARLEIARKLGWSSVPGNNYEVISHGEGPVVEGRGAGHGVGLCQRGAAGMARRGAAFQEILARYYPNTILAAGPGP